MVQLIVGNKGKGKTKVLLEKVNSEVKKTSGNIVYLDSNTKHMFELNNKIRLINVTDYAIDNCSEFIGFILGIISQDHDLQKMYFDSFLEIAGLSDETLGMCIDKLIAISEKFKVDFIISISKDASELPENCKPYIEVAL
ncbi:MAG: twitching motility protein PilT [Lachnospiraceae bacterium]|nr:twitching motility protein PilT [Lachnospiraceae bacterium]